ncbi:serine hydrolase domain-containing protein [Lederbergia panacisoli]|uniref:serine hydrolase domain-containing protein n=1 Tax=Lederbergia panacisoli TaxID=1255251 RepID=UPI00214BD3BD|nr:serine hydrolase [Lederbergia panacisoli]MCR2821206.1 beta-lactamase family protein [Lederbergia panacisoli]
MIQTKLPRSKPEEQNVSSQSILDFVNALETEELEVHSFIVLRHGQVIAEGTWAPYDKEDPHILNSLSKSFTSTAIGFAAFEGKLTVDDAVISFFPEYMTEEIENNMANLKVRHLLSMATGHDEDTTPYLRRSEDWVKEFFSIPVVHEPGTHFLYNTGATYMLSAILTKVTGMKLLDYLEPRLFKPLGMSDITTTTCPKGIHFGGSGMRVKIEDIAKFGLLYLQKGVWEGKQIVPEHWVEEATSKQISNGEDENNDWAQGYGYQFWRCRYGAYRGDGAFGQYCVVMPEQDAVIAVTSGVMDMGDILNLVWDHLLPGMSGTLEGEQLDLEHKLASLSYDAPMLLTASPNSYKWSCKQFEAGPNDASITRFSFNFSENTGEFTFWDSAGEQEFQFGYGEWIENDFSIAGEKVKAAVSGTWRNRNTFELTLRLLGTPFRDTWTCDFINGGVRINISRNIWTVPGLSDTALLPSLAGYIQ